MKAAAQRVAQWRWLTIGENSTVSANSLAERGLHMRNTVSDVNKQRRGKNNVDRVWGGPKALFSGDFHKFDPPSGASLRAIPRAWIQRARQHARGATEGHGQQITRGKGAAERRSCDVEGCAQGVTELSQCARARARARVRDGDARLLEVQREFREGALTADSRAFLRGRPTSAPGTWVNWATTCSAKCSARVAETARDDNAGCIECSRERALRRLAASGPMARAS